MANFKTPAQVETEYFSTLKAIKPSLNINDRNSDFVIRGKAFASLASGLYGDQQKVNNDTHVSSARPEAVIQEGLDYGILRQPATPAASPAVRVSGTPGTVVPVGSLTLLYPSTSVLYTNTSGGTIGSGGTLSLAIVAEVAGQIGNVSAPDSLQIVSPPAGVGTTATILTAISDGSDIEEIDSLRSRILSRKQKPPAGGNETDYRNFAFAASNAVRSARPKRFGRGLGTVDIYITTGTTDVDTAVTQGQAVSRIPSPAVLAEVQAYYDEVVPLTDCARVFSATETAIDVTVRVALADGLTMTSVPADPVLNPMSLNCGQLIRREISRVLYKLPVGGRKIPGTSSGAVIAADIETGLDVWLSAVPDPVTGVLLGKIPILVDREILPLNGSAYNKPIGENQLAAPGTLTVLEGN